MPIPGLLMAGGPIITKPPARFLGIGSTYNINLRSYHDAYYSTLPVPGQDVVFIVVPGANVGGSGTVAMNVGPWPAGVTPTLLIQGRVQGYGGNGGNGGGYGGDVNGQPGGTALYTRNLVNVVLTGGQLWGGGGGGGGADNWGNGSGMWLGGGGGAGNVVGICGTTEPTVNAVVDVAHNGTTENGGDGWVYPGYHPWYNGMGGDPGQPGYAFAGDSGGTFNRAGAGGAAGWSTDGAGYMTFGSWNGVRFIPGYPGDGDIRGPMG